MEARKSKTRPRAPKPPPATQEPPPPQPPPSQSPPPQSPPRGATAPGVPISHAMASQHQAGLVRDMLMPSYLSAMLGEQLLDRTVMKIYMNGFMHDAGDPDDPVERLLLEQLVMAHHRLGKLHLQANAAKTLECQKILNTAAARLLGEVRRMALTIRQYRQPLSPRQFNVVHQQNIATGAKQDVSYVDRSDSSGSKVSFSSRTEVEDKAAAVDARQEDDREHSGISGARQVSSPGRGRAGERLQAASLDG